MKPYYLKTFKKLFRLLTIDSNSVIFIPIFDSCFLIEYICEYYSDNKIIIALKDYSYYRFITKNSKIKQLITKKNNRIYYDFFGLKSIANFGTHNIKTIIYLPQKLSLNLIKYGILNTLSKLENSTIILSNNVSQFNYIKNILEDKNVDFNVSKRQGFFYFMINYIKQPRDLEEKLEYEKFNYYIQESEFNFLTLDNVFSKKNIDNGTDFLLHYTFNYLNISVNSVVLDYFSGIGIIGIVLKKICKFQKIFFLESDILSVELMEKNLNINKVENYSIEKKDGFINPQLDNNMFDLIISNPPTHSKLIDIQKFLHIARSLLKPMGRLVIVTNRYIKYERIISKLFSPKHVKIVFSNDKSYKIIDATKI